jgi:hypothetical protein
MLSQRTADASAFGADQFGRELFTPVEWAEFANPQARTIDSLIDDLRTHSAVLIMAPDERERALGRIRGYLQARPETGGGPFQLPMVTSALRSVRR